MIVQSEKYSRKLTFLSVSLLLSICFVFFNCTHQSRENNLPEYNSPEYNVEQVDKVPMYIKIVSPVYPPNAISRTRTMVQIRCLVDKNGMPHKIVAVESDPPDSLDVFAPYAVAAVKKWRFSPGEIRGKPVPTRVTFKIYFWR